MKSLNPFTIGLVTSTRRVVFSRSGFGLGISFHFFSAEKTERGSEGAGSEREKKRAESRE